MKPRDPSPVSVSILSLLSLFSLLSLSAVVFVLAALSGHALARWARDALASGVAGDAAHAPAASHASLTAADVTFESTAPTPAPDLGSPTALHAEHSPEAPRPAEEPTPVPAPVASVAPRVIALSPVVIVAAPVDGGPAASAGEATPRRCGHWRPLTQGPGAVRECESTGFPQPPWAGAIASGAKLR